jgi:hypothetical protein
MTNTNHTAFKTVQHMASTINDLAGMVDDYASQLAIEKDTTEANKILIHAIGMLDEKVSRLRTQLIAASVMTQRAA